MDKEILGPKEMTKICDDMRAKFDGIKHVAIHHRLGEVPVKDESIIIAISSPHRKASLDAVNFCINEVKRTVPIWKKVHVNFTFNLTYWLFSSSIKRLSNCTMTIRLCGKRIVNANGRKDRALAFEEIKIKSSLYIRLRFDWFHWLLERSY